jgi:hypothetical protein
MSNPSDSAALDDSVELSLIENCADENSIAVVELRRHLGGLRSFDARSAKSARSSPASSC